MLPKVFIRLEKTEGYLVLGPQSLKKAQEELELVIWTTPNGYCKSSTPV